MENKPDNMIFKTKIYELIRIITFPFMPALLGVVRKDVKTLIHGMKTSPKILDVGGRKSPYTIGLPISITLLDVPRETELQKNLNLGITDQELLNIKKTRSNISELILEDMTETSLKSESFDAVICVEVIEHVDKDLLFVENIHKVIKPGGWAYFTTPNGDYIKNVLPNYNPDHKRHYEKKQLEQLLLTYFNKVEIRYAVKTGKYRRMGLPGYTLKRPIRTLKSIFGNFVNKLQSKGLSNSSKGTAHLIAIGYKD